MSKENKEKSSELAVESGFLSVLNLFSGKIREAEPDVDLAEIFSQTDVGDWKQWGVHGWVLPVLGNQVYGILRSVHTVEGGKYGDRRAFEIEGAASLYDREDGAVLCRAKSNPEEKYLKPEYYSLRRGIFLVGDMAFSKAIGEGEVGRLFRIAFGPYVQMGAQVRKKAVVIEPPLEEQVLIRTKLNLEQIHPDEVNKPQSRNGQKRLPAGKK